MSPATAREERRRRVAELRAAEPDLSLRQMADRLDLSRDTVTRDLAEIDRRAAESAPPAGPPEQVAEEPSAGDAAEAAPVDDSAPQVTGGGRADQAPAGEASADPVAQVQPPAELPRRVSAERLEIDLRRWPNLRRGLAELATAGLTPEDAVVQAVAVLSAAYRQGLAQGRITQGPFVVRDVRVGPLLMPDRLVPRRPPAPAQGA